MALGILVVSLGLMVETQADSALMTEEAERQIMMADLAEMVMGEAIERVATEGFPTGDIEEEGEFDEFGDDVVQAAFGDTLEEFHWYYSIAEVDLAMAGDLAEAAQQFDSSDTYGNGDAPVDLGGGNDPMAGLSAMGLSGEAISQVLAPYIREVRVRVWFGKDQEDAEEAGNEIVVTTHVINPMGAKVLDQGVP